MVALVNNERWKNLVQLQIYYLDHNPAAGQTYAPITAGAAVINRKIKLPRVAIETLTGALEQAVSTMQELGIDKTTHVPVLIEE